ncbi:MAG: F0F1 ATP synthase subunit epsilon [Planctomycetaceae bacterium]|nr:F0F1 ATP synthase subunit epsilon [Planctomycetaceae bacterium]
MIAATQLRLVLVTPETTLVDAPATSIVAPMFDGQLGILPGRTPAVGRLGTGELRFQGEGGEQRYFIDGGFLQIKGSVVTVLTHEARPVSSIDLGAAEQALQQANGLVARTDEEAASKLHAQQRARRMIALRRGR